jgi:hypothetical protein
LVAACCMTAALQAKGKASVVIAHCTGSYYRPLGLSLALPGLFLAMSHCEAGPLLGVWGLVHHRLVYWGCSCCLWEFLQQQLLPFHAQQLITGAIGATW